MARWRKHGTTSNVVLTILYYLSSFFQIFGSLIYPVKSLIEVLEFRIWVNQKFGDVPQFKNKKKLLNMLIDEANKASFQTPPRGRDVLYIEFGVAFGETTEYLVSRTTNTFLYHGFDTFEGLPKAWRRLPIGAMSSNSQTPNIVRSNVFFHKGLIQETIKEVNFDSTFMKCFIFDFDLYEPTLFAFKHVLPDIKSGDIVYFDEAFDSDERVIIENYFINQFKYLVIGASPFSLVFKVL